MKTKEMILVFSAMVTIGLLLMVSAGYALTGGSLGNNVSEGTTNNNVLIDENAPAQEVTLKYENWQYVMEPNELQAGVPVKLVVDMNTVRGCMRDVVISSFGIRKYVREGDNVIEFMPDKTGEFQIACSMNMGRTSFTVVDAQGNTGSYREPSLDAPPPSAGNCGSGSSGCGCGA